MTVAISTVISAINSLTLSPALAALLLKGHHAEPDALQRVINALFGWFFRGFNWAFSRGSNGYGRGVGGVLKIKSLVMIIYAVMLGATWWLFRRYRAASCRCRTSSISSASPSYPTAPRSTGRRT